MILALDAAGTVRDLSSAPADAEPAYLALTMHLRPVVDRYTLAGVLGEIAAMRADMDEATTDTMRAHMREELAALHVEAREIRAALAAAAEAADND